MPLNRRVGVRWTSVAGVSALALLIGGIAQAASRSSEWTPTAAQLQAASVLLSRVATADDPSQAPPDAASAAELAGGKWPSNVSATRVVGLSRRDALIAMGTPDAVVPGDDQQVLLVELRGAFTPRNLPTPQGAPMRTYSYAQFAVDAQTGYVLDWGFVDAPMTLPDSAQALS